MKKGDKAAIVSCSNGRPASFQPDLDQLQRILMKMGLVPVLSDYIFEKDSVFSGTGKERAESLMDFYKDDEIKAIFDISGGDLANEILNFLDYETIAKSDKLFWGYSDLTCVINAIYSQTGLPSVLYQVRNLASDESGERIRRFQKTVMEDNQKESNAGGGLLDIACHFIQGSKMCGVVVGGNIRCLLKLAGTPYWPDMNGKILLLEAYKGGVPQMTAFLNQLKQIGVFEQVSGILLGTFTHMEKEQCAPDIVELVKRYAGEKLPIAQTKEIGHGADARAIIIGKEMELKA